MTLEARVGMGKESSSDTRIELILDLTRRIELLEKLMQRARERRLTTDRAHSGAHGLALEFGPSRVC
jgi:hypothetical protein